MSKWINRISSHQFCQNLESLSNTLEKFELPLDASEEAVVDYARMKKVVNYLQVLITTSDPDLISPNFFNDASGQMSHVLTQFNNFVGNKNASHLTAANNHLDAVIASVSKIFFFGKLKNTDIKSIHNSYSQVLDKHLKSYKTQVEKDKGELHTSFDNLKTNVGNLEKKITDSDSQLEKLTTQADTKLSDFEERFIKANNTRDDEFKNAILKLNEKVDNEFSSLVDKSTKAIKALDSLKSDAEEVFGVIQNTVQAGAHKLYADEEKISANRYRGFAISLMIMAVSLIIVPEIYTIFKSVNLDNSFDVKKLLQRIPISLVLFVPAFYLAKESNKHRQNEFNNRRQEMVLRTIDPYLSLLAGTKREEIKGIVAKNLFCNTQNNTSNEDDAVGILDRVIKMVKECKGK